MYNTTNKIVALAITTQASFLMTFMSSSISIALPSIGKEFETNAILLSWIVTSYLLATAICLVPFGRIADIVGIKKIFTYGIFIYTISSLLSAVSTSAVMLIFFRVLQGIGGAMTISTSIAILSSIFPTGEKGKALGINAAAIYFGLTLGPFLGGLLTEHFGWRSIFIANIPLGLITIVFTFWKIKGDWSGAKGEKFDFIGSAIYSLLLISLMYGFSLLPSILGAGLILVGVLGFLAFVKWETKSESPVLNIGLFRNNRVFTFSNFATLANYSATYAVVFLLSLYLQYIKGFSPQNAGLILVSKPIIQAALSPFTGRLSDKIEPQKVASVGMALTSVALFLFSFLNKNTALALIIACLILLGFGLGLFASPNTNAVMSSVKPRFYGVASATLSTMRATGGVLSMGITTLLFAIYMGRVEITPEYYPLFLTSARIAFAIFATLCLGGIFASLARGKIQ